MELKAWIMSVVGAAVLTLLSDIVLPDGETNGYVKSAISIFIVFLIAFPIPSFIRGEAVTSFSDAMASANGNYCDEGILSSLNEMRRLSIEEEIYRAFKEEGIEGCEISVACVTEDGFMKIDRVLVSLEKLVIPAEMTNIMVTERIAEIIISITGVKKEAICFE